MDAWSSTENSWKLVQKLNNYTNNANSPHFGVQEMTVFEDYGYLYSSGDIVLNQVCLPKNTFDCYYFEIYDTWGDGLSDSTAGRDNYWVQLDTYNVANGHWGGWGYQHLSWRKRFDFCIGDYFAPTTVPTPSPTITCTEDDDVLFTSKVSINVNTNDIENLLYAIDENQTNWKLSKIDSTGAYNQTVVDEIIFTQSISLDSINFIPNITEYNVVIENEACLQLNVDNYTQSMTNKNCYVFELVSCTSVIDVNGTDIIINDTGSSNINCTINGEYDLKLEKISSNHKWKSNGIWDSNFNSKNGSQNYIHIELCLNNIFSTLAPTSTSLPTSMPQPMPTMVPIQNPSLPVPPPTYNPTNFDNNTVPQPTNLPTGLTPIPTTIPSIVPSDSPSSIPSNYPTPIPTSVGCNINIYDGQLKEEVKFVVLMDTDYWVYVQTNWTFVAIEENVLTQLENGSIIDTHIEHVINSNSNMDNSQHWYADEKYETCLSLKHINDYYNRRDCYYFKLTDIAENGFGGEDGLNFNVQIYLDNILLRSDNWVDGLFWRFDFCLS